MRKQTISSGSESVSRLDDAWLDLEQLAKVEVTSESADQPIESALIPNRGWAGELRNRENRRSASFLTTPLASGISSFGSSRWNGGVYRNSCCAGYLKATNRSVRSYVSSIPSVPPPLTKRARITGSISTESPPSN